MNNDNLIHPLLHSLSPMTEKTKCGGTEVEWNVVHFSKIPCDCCGTHKAGERTQVEAMRHSDNPKDNGLALLADPYDVCNDCVIQYQ